MTRTATAFLIAASIATAATAARRAPPIATPNGAPVDCVSLTDIRETRVRDDRTIDFILNGGRVLRNTLPYACSQLGFEESFAYATSLSRLCSVDIITMLQRGSAVRGASCGLGKFQPVTLTPAHR